MKNLISKSEIIKAIRKSPPISSSGSLLLKTTADPNHNLSDIVDIIKYDDILTASLLRVINSAAFALLVPVHSIDRAISLLGEDEIVNIAIGKTFSKSFNKPLDGYGSLPGDLWKHNLRTAIASAEIAKFSKGKIKRDIAFTCGIVHDIGKTVISDFLKGTAKEIIDSIKKGKFTDYLSAEKELLGMDHQEVGYELAKHWRLPKNMQSAIQHHHNPSKADEEMRPFIYTIHIGDFIAMIGGSGTGSDDFKYHMDEGYSDFLDITPDDLPKILLTVDDEFKKIEASIAS